MLKEIHVKKPRIYLTHRTKLRLAKGNGSKGINPSFILPKISLKDAVQMEDALSTVVLPAKIFTDQIEYEFCPITHPQVGHQPLRVNNEQHNTSKVREEHVTEIHILRENCTKPTEDEPTTRRRKIFRGR